LDRSVAERFVASLECAWRQATEPGHSEEATLVEIGRFMFLVTTGSSPRVMPFAQSYPMPDQLEVHSEVDFVDLSRFVMDAVELADRLEEQPPPPIDELPPLIPPALSQWIAWRSVLPYRWEGVEPSDLWDGRHRHIDATHGRSTYPDPQGCGTCWREAYELVEYNNERERRAAARKLQEDMTTPPSGTPDEIGGGATEARPTPSAESPLGLALSADEPPQVPERWEEPRSTSGNPGVVHTVLPVAVAVIFVVVMFVLFR
jgi:hypothetical protein